MVDLFKNLWWIVLIFLAGGVIFFLSLRPNGPQGDQGVVLNDIFHQQTPSADPVSNEPSALAKRSDPVPPMAIVTSPVDGHETAITIQVYSFQDKNRALTALESLKAGGYQAFLIISDLGPKGVWYRVRVGGLRDEQSAHKILEEIRKNYNSGFILKS